MRLETARRFAVDWVRVTLAAAETERVREVLEDAWRMKAPKRVLAAFDEARAG